MNVAAMIEWLKTKPQHLQVCVLEVNTYYDSEENPYEHIESVCFDEPEMQSHQTGITLTLGVQ